MKRVMACLVLAVVVAGCGNGTSPDQLEDEVESEREAMPECRLLAVRQWPESGTSMDWEIRFPNLRDERTRFQAKVDFFYEDTWIGTTSRQSPDTPSGAVVLIDGEIRGLETVSSRSTDRYRCEVYELTP